MEQSRYTTGTYLESNPTWHAEDAPWKARHILDMLDAHGLRPRTICEVGCGAGGILRELHDKLDFATELVGYDISPQALELARPRATDRLRFELRDVLDDEDGSFDLILVMDVIEHMEDYFGLLRGMRRKSGHQLFHIPLDLSALSVARPHVLLEGRESLGHIHYFIKDTALQLLRDLEYQIVDQRYTFRMENPEPSPKAYVLKYARKALFSADPDLAVRLLGGHSLLVLTR